MLRYTSDDHLEQSIRLVAAILQIIIDRPTICDDELLRRHYDVKLLLTLFRYLM